MIVRLVWLHDVSTTLATLEEMFRELGGVPKRIVSDNPKCFSLEASKYEPLLNPAYERFAAHYGTQIECLPPRSPELKELASYYTPFRLWRQFSRFLLLVSNFSPRLLTGLISGGGSNRYSPLSFTT